jgi:photosystem II stability/assembly factor-like uncharacterized protein
MIRLKTICHALLLPLVLLCCTLPASAAHYVWKNVRVGGGGFIPAVVFSRAAPGLAYLRSDIGGAYRWNAKAGTWVPLEDDIADGNYFGVESIAPDPLDADVVYAAVGTYRNQPAAILRSADRGAHWHVTPVSFRMGGNDAGRGLGERLTIDPNNTAILYFGSRYDGLQRSTDHGESWSKVTSFPIAGRRAPTGYSPGYPGIAFVIVDPASGSKGHGSRTIFAGSAEPGAPHMFRSDDGGASWKPIAGEPDAALLPVQAQLDSHGNLYIAYCTGIGPNGVKGGAVYKLDTHNGHWTNITPDKSAKAPAGGYMGISLDRENENVLLVATMNRTSIGDTLWRTTDAGRHWTSLRETSSRNVSATPFLLWGQPQANFGWWMAGVAIDPFDSNHALYTTGATLYATDELKNADHGKTISWHPWTKGIEETAILALASPPKGPHLYSGFGDIGGFAHTDLSKSPATMYTNPIFNNTNTVDFAPLAPNVVVRSGTAHRQDSKPVDTLAYSLDFGKSWAPIAAPPMKFTDAAGKTELRRFDQTGDAAIITAADGSAFIVMTPAPLITRDHGAHWSVIQGLPQWSHVVADRADPKRFYAIDLAKRIILSSDDGGLHFTPLDTHGLPGDVALHWPTRPDTAWPLMATPGKAGDLWLLSNGRLYHSTDGGQNFAQVQTYMGIELLAFGKPAPGSNYPALFAIAWSNQLRAVFRSDDAGKSWVRVNDNAHEYGRKFRCIAGDPRIYGRVYVGTDGRGIVYGDIAK